MVYYNPHLNGHYNLVYTLNIQGFCHCSFDGRTCHEFDNKKQRILSLVVMYERKRQWYC